MKHTFIMTLLALMLAVGTPRSAQASFISMDHLQTIAQNVVTSLISQYLRDYLKQFIDPATGDHEGVLKENLTIYRHRGGSHISKRYAAIPDPHEWGSFRENIDTIVLSGVPTTVFTRYYSSHVNPHGMVLTTPYNPYHTGKYSTSCEEYTPGSGSIKKVTANGDTIWQMSVTASNLGKIMQEGIGLQTVLGMWCRYMPPFCPTEPYPLVQKFVSSNVKWNSSRLVYPPENQIYIPFVTYFGGSLWTP